MSGRADPKPLRITATDDDAEAREDFRVAVLAIDRCCVVHDDPLDCSGGIHAHHVVYQQHLRKAGRGDLLWDPLNGTAICKRAHERHHSGTERIYLDLLPDRCVAFAREHGFADVLRRFYPARAW